LAGARVVDPMGGRITTAWWPSPKAGPSREKNGAVYQTLKTKKNWEKGDIDQQAFFSPGPPL